jgi:hypothetical protein
MPTPILPCALVFGIVLLLAVIGLVRFKLLGTEPRLQLATGVIQVRRDKPRSGHSFSQTAAYDAGPEGGSL